MKCNVAGTRKKGRVCATRWRHLQIVEFILNRLTDLRGSNLRSDMFEWDHSLPVVGTLQEEKLSYKILGAKIEIVSCLLVTCNRKFRFKIVSWTFNCSTETKTALGNKHFLLGITRYLLGCFWHSLRTSNLCSAKISVIERPRTLSMPTVPAWNVENKAKVNSMGIFLRWMFDRVR